MATTVRESESPAGTGGAARTTAAPLAVTRDLAVGYAGTPVIEAVTFAVAPGDRIGLLGPNGGGKSTLFRALLGGLVPVGGTLDVAVSVATVPQTERSRLDYPVSALDVALMGTLSRLPWWHRPGRRERRQALTALDTVGLADLASRTFGELSGGQRQRVLVARALVQDARLLLLDEPFSGLDAPAADRLMDLIDALAAEGRGVVVATHDVEQVQRWDLVLCLNHDQVAFGPPATTLTGEVLEATYGGSIVRVPGDGEGPARVILPPHHHDHA